MREIEDEARKLGGYYPGGSYETKEQCQAAIDKDPTGKTFSF